MCSPQNVFLLLTAFITVGARPDSRLNLPFPFMCDPIFCFFFLQFDFKDIIFLRLQGRTITLVMAPQALQCRPCTLFCSTAGLLFGGCILQKAAYICTLIYFCASLLFSSCSFYIYLYLLQHTPTFISNSTMIK